MVADLNIATRIVGVPTVREADGLALSSRNAQLSPDDRVRAVALSRGLEAARDAVIDGVDVQGVLSEAEDSLLQAGFSKIDYFALVDAATLEPLDRPGGEMRLIAAAVIGNTRLIDNMPV
jgi:pantoate--beta-alanine ligase